MTPRISNPGRIMLLGTNTLAAYQVAVGIKAFGKLAVAGFPFV